MKQHEKNPAKPSAPTVATASPDAAQEAFTSATDLEIERVRVSWARKQRAGHLDFVKHFSFHTSSTFRDYLHGDVQEGEAWFACLYEYARESKGFREAARRRDELKAKGLDGFDDAQRAAWEKLSDAKRTEKAAVWAVQELQDKPSFLIEMTTFLECESFPKKDWQELSPQERSEIMRFRQTRKVSPLAMPDVWTLKTARILEKFEAMAEKAKPVVEDHDPQRGKFARPYKPVPSLLQQHESLYHAIFTLDFSEAETQLVNRFREWLGLPEIQTLREKHKRPKRPAVADTSRDRLKDLAAWRLYREKENDLEAANDFADKHRKCFSDQAQVRRTNKDLAKNDPRRYKIGDKRPFRDAKQQTEKQASGTLQIIPANQAGLFGEDADAREAQASAWKHLAELMPSEFAPPGRFTLAMLVELEKQESAG